MTVTLPEPGRMDGRTVVLTGASSGIGRYVAGRIAELGADLVVVGRDPERTRQVAAATGARAFLADYDRLDSVRDLAAGLLDALPRIDVLANNAGAVALRACTPDGNDLTLQRNHLAGFLLTDLLLPRIRQTAAAALPGTVRIVQTSSDLNRLARLRLTDLDNRRGPVLAGAPAYNRSKLANILFSRELARRLRGTGVAAYSFNPSLTASGLRGDGLIERISGRFASPTSVGAEGLVRLIAAPSIPAPSGNHFDRLVAPGREARQGRDAALARDLWVESARRTGVPAD